MSQQLLNDLAKAKAMFQQRAILTVMEVPESETTEQCPTCGDHHREDVIPFTCQKGDGI